MILLRPWWLAAVIPILLLGWMAMRRTRAGGWEGIVNPAVMARMRALGMVSGATSRWPSVLPFLAAAIAAVALSGPARMIAAGALIRQDPLILLIDMSPSVAGGARLADAQAAAAQALGLAGRPVGAALYAAQAYVASAPTSDAASLQGLIAVLGPDTMPLAGSRPDIAIGSLDELFGTLDGADILLISDGGSAGPRAEEQAARLADSGARLWALSLDGPGPDGAPAADPAALEAIARAGGGTALPAREAGAMMQRIETARTARLATSDEARRVFRDLGPFLIPFAMVAILPLFRRRG
ncbi:VWA domain-containing protein [Falsirhodobacter xinxiangensis]|uniref:VWA domain-containing protein n=1 Tax=Falsirhodobacter xinxiangensis TaxID=2530049 RepID=UPI0010A9B8EF|nr:VWA domain-containing protein [Rhodobacter xinxiangensis]